MTFDELYQAAESGNVGAQLQLGRFLIQRHNFQEGIHFMLDGIAQTGNLEDIFYINVAINNVTSIAEKRGIFGELFARATANECTASYILGQCYEDSYLVPQDYEKSIYYYERSARGGFSPAAEKLGAYYLKIKDDVKEGIFWYFVAAENGSDAYAAWYSIGLNIFFTEVTVGKETYKMQTDADIVHTLIYCAEKGSVLAQFLLARRYEKGNGVPQDMSKAQYLYDKIASEGNDLRSIVKIIEDRIYTIFRCRPKY